MTYLDSDIQQSILNAVLTAVPIVITVPALTLLFATHSLAMIRRVWSSASRL